MRTLAPFGVVIESLLLAGAASAENRTFIIPNNPDGYGIGSLHSISRKLESFTRRR